MVEDLLICTALPSATMLPSQAGLGSSVPRRLERPTTMCDNATCCVHTGALDKADKRTGLARKEPRKTSKSLKTGSIAKDTNNKPLSGCGTGPLGEVASCHPHTGDRGIRQFLFIPDGDNHGPNQTCTCTPDNNINALMTLAFVSAPWERLVSSRLKNSNL